jgi:hypothetical protein
MNLAVIASAWIVLVSVVSVAQAGDSEHQFTEQLTQTIATVRTGKNAVARTEAVEHLADLTRRSDSKKLDDKTVADQP